MKVFMQIKFTCCILFLSEMGSFDTKYIQLRHKILRTKQNEIMKRKIVVGIIINFLLV